MTRAPKPVIDPDLVFALALGNYVVLGWLIGQARARLAFGNSDSHKPHRRGDDKSLLVMVSRLRIVGAAIAA